MIDLYFLGKKSVSFGPDHLLVYPAVGLLSYISAFVFDYLRVRSISLKSPWKFSFRIKRGLDTLPSLKLGF